MTEPNQFDEVLAMVVNLWDQRRQEFESWHGIGIQEKGCTRILHLYIETEKDRALLERSIGQIRISTDIRIIKMIGFRKCPPTPAASTSDFIFARSFTKANVQACDDVLAQDDRCKVGQTGTIAGFLRVTSGPRAGSIWLLSANHILARRKICRENLLIFSNFERVATRLKEIALSDIGNQVDAAAVELKTTATAICRYPTLNLTSAVSGDLTQTSTVEKDGVGTGRTTGKVFSFCPRIQIAPDPDIGEKGFINQWMVESSSDLPFVADQDSGSLVVADQKPAGLVVAAAERSDKIDDSQSKDERFETPGRFAIVSPFKIVINQLSTVLEGPVEFILNQDVAGTDPSAVPEPVPILEAE